MDIVLKKKLYEMDFYNDNHRIVNTSWGNVLSGLDLFDDIHQKKSLSAAMVLGDDAFYLAIKGLEQHDDNASPLLIYKLNNAIHQSDHNNIIKQFNFGARPWINHIYPQDMHHDEELRDYLRTTSHKNMINVSFEKQLYANGFYTMLMNDTDFNHPIRYFSTDQKQSFNFDESHINLNNSHFMMNTHHKYFRVLTDDNGYTHFVFPKKTHETGGINPLAANAPKHELYKEAELDQKPTHLSFNLQSGDQVQFAFKDTNDSDENGFHSYRHIETIELKDSHNIHEPTPNLNITYAKQTDTLWDMTKDGKANEMYAPINFTQKCEKNGSYPYSGVPFRFLDRRYNTGFDAVFSHDDDNTSPEPYYYRDFLVQIPVGDSNVSFKIDAAPSISNDQKMVDYIEPKPADSNDLILAFNANKDTKYYTHDQLHKAFNMNKADGYYTYDQLHKTVNINGNTTHYIDMGSFMTINDDSPSNFMIMTFDHPIDYFVNDKNRLVSSKKFELKSALLPVGVMAWKGEPCMKFKNGEFIKYMAYQHELYEGKYLYRVPTILKDTKTGYGNKQSFKAAYSPVASKWKNVGVLRDYYQNMRVTAVDHFGQASKAKKLFKLVHDKPIFAHMSVSGK